MIVDNFWKSNKIHIRNFFLLLLICLLAYWPLTFGVFSVKNDAIHYFLSFRFNISEAIRNGDWPFWSPYIYLGYPISGDMQSGAWNPIVWLISLISRYDVTVFHYENLLYIFLSGVGMYKLTFHFEKHTQTAFLIAACYMLSGFMLGGQLINWLASAAFIPFVILYYHRLLSSTSYSEAIKTSISLYLLFTAGYPSFFIITFYLLLLLFIRNIFEKWHTQKKVWGTIILQHVTLIIVFIGLILPAFVSYISLLPYYSRGTGVNYADTVRNSFEWQHLISFLFPSTIRTNDIISSTDVTCRNVYIGIIPFIALFSFPPKLTKRNISLIFLLFFSFLFSLGDATPIRRLCYNLIPFMDTFRHPSQMRLYIILALLLLSAPGIKTILNEKISHPEIRKFKKITLGFLWSIAAITIFAIIKSTLSFPHLFDHMEEFRLYLKKLIHSFSFYEAISINGILQFLTILFFYLCIFRWKTKRILIISISVINLILLAQLILPFTFVGKTPAKEINKLINASPKGYPIAGMDKSIGCNSKDAKENFNTIALSYFYNKKVGISDVTNSPSFLTSQEKFLGSPLLYEYISSLPVIYLADTVAQLKDTTLLLPQSKSTIAFMEQPIQQTNTPGPVNNVELIQLSSNRFEIETENSSGSFLVLTQNYHPDWEVWVDGKKGIVNKTNITFMGCYLSAGKHQVIFKFNPHKTIIAMWIQLFSLLSILICSLFYLSKKRSL